MSLKGRSCWVVNIRMDDAEKLSLEGIGRFVEASEEIRFEAADREQLYGWVERVLVGQQYAEQGKAARGLVRRYIVKMTGLSRAQETRLIARCTASGRVQVMRSDSHIPSAPRKTARLSRIQNPKGENRLRRPFASFRIIFGLEKTVNIACIINSLYCSGRRDSNPRPSAPKTGQTID